MGHHIVSTDKHQDVLQTFANFIMENQKWVTIHYRYYFISVTTCILWHNRTNLSLIVHSSYLITVTVWFIELYQDIGKFIWFSTLSVGYGFFINGDYSISNELFCISCSWSCPAPLLTSRQILRENGGKGNNDLIKAIPSMDYRDELTISFTKP